MWETRVPPSSRCTPTVSWANDPNDDPMAEITAEPAPRERSRADVQCAPLPNGNDDAAQGDRKDNQNSEDGEGTGEEQIEKGAEQDAGAVGDFLSDMG